MRPPLSGMRKPWRPPSSPRPLPGRGWRQPQLTASRNDFDDRLGGLPVTLQLVGLTAAWLASGYRLWVSFRQPATVWRTAFTVGIVCAALG